MLSVRREGRECHNYSCCHIQPREAVAEEHREFALPVRDVRRRRVARLEGAAADTLLESHEATIDSDCLALPLLRMVHDIPRAL